MQMLQMNVARFFFNSHKVMLDHISQKEKERKKLSWIMVCIIESIGQKLTTQHVINNVLLNYEKERFC